MAKKIYDDGMSPELRYYHRNKEKILARKAAERAANPSKFAALRETRKDKENAQKREYRAKNKERIAAYFRENAERISANRREKYRVEREQVCAKRRAQYAANPEVVRDAVNAWAAANRDKRRAGTIAWRQQNPEKARLQSATKRARKRNATGKVSLDIVARLLKLQNGKCTCCSCALDESGHHLDHVVPLALGGMHDDTNLQLLCPPCNLSKHAKHPVDFMQSRGFLL